MYYHLICRTPEKPCHRTRQMAQREAKYIRKRRGYRLFEYWCCSGHHWHLTSQRPTLRTQLANILWELIYDHQ